MAPQNLIYLFSAYTIIFLVLFGYLVFIQQQVGDLKSQVRALRKRWDAKSGTETPRAK